MSKEKYLANIDKVLQNVIRKTSGNMGDKNRILYSEELEADGTFKKVAFDVYRVENDPYSGLWTLEDIEGKSYLIRASDPQYETKDNGSWTVTSNYDKNNVTLAYKNIPIAGFSSDKYGFSSEDIITFKMALLESVNEDETFVKSVLHEQPNSKKEALVSTFPEFKKFL